MQTTVRMNHQHLFRLLQNSHAAQSTYIAMAVGLCASQATCAQFQRFQQRVFMVAKQKTVDDHKYIGPCRQNLHVKRKTVHKKKHYIRYDITLVLAFINNVVLSVNSRMTFNSSLPIKTTSMACRSDDSTFTDQSSANTRDKGSCCIQEGPRNTASSCFSIAILQDNNFPWEIQSKWTFFMKKCNNQNQFMKNISWITHLSTTLHPFRFNFVQKFIQFRQTTNQYYTAKP